ncbi:MAG: exosortase system-associated protein, TIGR04073 family [Candidatus Omnitrophota bacterium]
MRKITSKKKKAHRRCKRLISGILPLIFIAAYAVCGFAEEADNAGEKLAEGVGEAATGWVEVPKEIVETSEESNPIEGITVGTLKGVGEAVVKTTEGVVKAATFYIPDEEGEEGKEGEEE